MHFTKLNPSHSQSMLQFFLLMVIVAVASSSKELPKRSLDEANIQWSANAANNARHPSSVGTSGWSSAGAGGWNVGHNALGSAPSPHDVANAISAAKQASANVLLALRLAASKAEVAHQQRVAATLAATALQHSAHAAAAEIQKAEYEAAKFGHYIRNGHGGHGGAAHQLAFVKDPGFGSLSSGNNHFAVSNLESIGFGPWSGGHIGIAGKSANGWY
ncbi:uncharacterized protein Dwil_GK10628 [Drosophila willistoni]|uniref:Attacin C-terminal domain-containing protein n=1 Tax=Drosophila willistoni TaxID=7260 RepID=B4MIZ5_DROWI|nr:uncharacterized protein Dwil_GK10628 [Drosophila willistoni]